MFITWCSIILIGTKGVILAMSLPPSNSSADSVNNCAIQWVPRNQFNPAEYERAGKEIQRDENNSIIDDIDLYAARAHINFTSSTGEVKLGVIPGKFVPVYNEFHSAYNNTIYTLYTGIEVLKAPRGSVSWIPGNWLKSPENLIPAGFDPVSPMEIYFICRISHLNSAEGIRLLTPGMLSSDGVCLVTYYGIITSTDYEVLVVNKYGREIEGADVTC